VNKFLIKEIAQYTNAGLATTVARNSMAENVNLTDTKSVITYLTNLPDARFQADAVAKVLNTRKDQPDFAIKLAHVIGSNAIDMTTLVADLKARPELKARFYENINTAGANQSSTLGALLDGKGAEQATEKANKITEILKQKTQ
jgi:hypothetical protein